MTTVAEIWILPERVRQVHTITIDTVVNIKLTLL